MKRLTFFLWMTILLPLSLFPFSLSFETIGEYEGDAVYTKVKVVGRYGFLVAGEKGIQIFDLSRPHMPKKISEIGSMSYSYSLDVKGFRLFLADGAGGVRIFDIRDKENPQQISFIPTNNSSLDLKVSGDYCYVAEGKGGLRIIDVSKPIFPQEISNWKSDYVKSVEIVDDFAYLAAQKGVLILRISKPDSLVDSLWINVIDSVDKVVSDGRFIFASSDEHGLLVSDVSTVEHPLVQKMPDIYIGIEDIFVSGFYLYVVQKNLVWVFNILSPFDPKFEGKAVFPGEISGIYVNGNLLYAACGFDGFKIIKIEE